MNPNVPSSTQRYSAIRSSRMNDRQSNGYAKVTPGKTDAWGTHAYPGVEPEYKTALAKSKNSAVNKKLASMPSKPRMNDAQMKALGPNGSTGQFMKATIARQP